MEDTDKKKEPDDKAPPRKPRTDDVGTNKPPSDGIAPFDHQERRNEVP